MNDCYKEQNDSEFSVVLANLKVGVDWVICTHICPEVEDDWISCELGRDLR